MTPPPSDFRIFETANLVFNKIFMNQTLYLALSMPNLKYLYMNVPLMINIAKAFHFWVIFKYSQCFGKWFFLKNVSSFALMFYGHFDVLWPILIMLYVSPVMRWMVDKVLLLWTNEGTWLEFCLTRVCFFEGIWVTSATSSSQLLSHFLLADLGKINMGQKTNTKNKKSIHNHLDN